MDQARLNDAMSNLPPEVKNKFSALDDNGKRAFVDNIASQINSTKPTIGKSGPASEMGGRVMGRANIFSLANATTKGQGLEELGLIGEQAGQDALGILEGASAGIPRGVIESLTDIDIDRGSKIGQFAGFFAGPGKLANILGKKAMGTVGKDAGTRIGKATAKNFMGRGIKKGLVRGAKGGAVEGLVGGALIPHEDALNFKDRLISGFAGLVLGAPIGASIGGVGSFFKQKKLVGMADRVTKKLNKIASRRTGEAVTDGPIYDVAGNPTSITKQSIKDPVTGKVKIFDRKEPKLRTAENPKTPFKKVSDADLESVRNRKSDKVNFLKKSADAELADIKNQGEINLANIESSQKTLKQMLDVDSDEAINLVKDKGRKWVNAYYDSYGTQLDNIANDMAGDGVTIKVSQVYDELAGVLNNRRINVGGVGGTANPTTSETMLTRWVSKLNKSLNPVDDVAEEVGKGFPTVDKAMSDSTMRLSDVLDEVKRIRGAGDMRLSREIDGAISNILSNSGGVKYASRIGKLKSDYAKFVPMRDFVEDSFMPLSDDVMKGRKSLTNVANKGSDVIDKTLDVDQIRKLEQLEKELGIPFLRSIREYGGSYDDLVRQTESLKKQLAESVKGVRGKLAESLSGARTDATQETALLMQKRARTENVSNAIQDRLKSNLRTVFDKIDVPETVARQMETAAFAYILTRVLGRAISSERS